MPVRIGRTAADYRNALRRTCSNQRPAASRDECLNEHWFTVLMHARTVIETWRREYNEERPKKALDGLTPSAYAQHLAEVRLQ